MHESACTSGMRAAELLGVVPIHIKKLAAGVSLLCLLASVSSNAEARRRLPPTPPPPPAAADNNNNNNNNTTIPSNAPFRAKLLENAALARKTAATLNAIAKMPAQVTASSKLSSTERKLFADQTKWLSDSSARLIALSSQMDVVLAKGANAPATEIAQMNMKLLTLRETLESESRRFGDLAAARARHQAALHAITGSK
jgi:hypothetical protein